MTTTKPLPTIDGYQLMEKLGQGGMGAVYKARQLSMDRIVAVKILPPKFSKDESYVSRFLREARLAGRLNHENVVQAIGVGHENGYYYISMEYVEGTNIGELLKKKGPFPEKEALRIVRQAALGLKCAHDHDLIHRDIKPDNIMVDKRGTIKLADLGLARTEKENSSLTQTGITLGTPHYASPEQARGDADIDHRCDFYSLGATLYHMLTGHTPFEDKSGAVLMAKHIMEEPVPARERFPEGQLSDGTCHLIEWLMKKDKNERPENAEELAAEIERVLAGLTSSKGRAAGGALARRKTGRMAPVGKRASGRQRRRSTGHFIPVDARRSVGTPRRGAGGGGERPLGTRAAPRNSMPLILGGAAVAIFAAGALALALSSGPSKGRRAKQQRTHAQPLLAKRVRKSLEKTLRTGAAAPAKASRTTASARPAPAKVIPDPEDVKSKPLPVLGTLARPAAGSAPMGPSSPNRTTAVAAAKKSSPKAPLEGPEKEQKPRNKEASHALPLEAQPLYAQLTAARQARDFERARDLLRKAKAKARFQPFIEQIDEAEDDVDRVEKLLARAEANVPLRKGETIRAMGQPGKIVEFENGKVVLDMGGAQIAVSMRTKIAPGEVLKFFDKQPGMSDTEAALARAAFWMAVQNPKEARRAIQGLSANAPAPAKGQAAAMAERLDGLEHFLAEKHLEQEAQKELKALQAALGGRHGIRFDEMLKRFRADEARFGQTRTWSGARPRLEALRRKLIAASGRPEHVMVTIPAGPFLYGPEKIEKALPAFKISKYEVSNAQYRKFVQWVLGDDGNLAEARERLKPFRNEQGPEDVLAYVPRYFPEYRKLAFAHVRDGDGDAPEGMKREGSGRDKKTYRRKREGSRHNKDAERRMDAMQEWGQWAKQNYKDENPVMDISWYAADAYARWVGKRLPTAEEWDKAARGTDGREMPAGPWNRERDAVKYNGGNRYEFRDAYKSLAPVQSMPRGASPYGIHHMSGNVWEYIAAPGQCRGGDYRLCQAHLSLNCRDEKKTVLEPAQRGTSNGIRLERFPYPCTVYPQWRK